MQKKNGWRYRLALVVLLGGGIISPPKHSGAAENKFMGAEKCKSCHKKTGSGEAFQKWENSLHAKAYMVLGVPKAKEIAEKLGIKGNLQQEPKCLKCHVTAYGVDPKLVDSKFKMESGVQCESCHGAGKGYRKKKVMINPEEAKKKGLISHPDEKVCTECHNSDSPTWNPNKYTNAAGKKVGFDFEQAQKVITHKTPEDYKQKMKTDKDEEEEEE